MRKLLSKIFPNGKDIRPFVQEIKPESNPLSANIFSTTVPDNQTFEEWNNGGWNKTLNPENERE